MITTHVPSKDSSSATSGVIAENRAYDSMLQDGRSGRDNLKVPTEAVSISVTTASHADPSTSSCHFNMNVVNRGMPQHKQLYFPPAKEAILTPPSNMMLPATLAGPEGGFTLPGAHFGSATAALSSNMSSPYTSLHRSMTEGALRAGYSAASRASVSAQGVKKATKSGLGRRTSSAPSTLALSPKSSKAKYKYRKVVGGKLPRSQSMTLDKEISPQSFLNEMISARGYCTSNFCSLEGGYYCKPTPLQKASYGVKTLQAVRASDENLLRRMLDCGLSPNAANPFGESVVHMVCRRGDHKLLKVLMDAGCSLQVTDDFGRTPLHDACWTAEPSFECVELILNTDERLLHVVDCRGASPLSYVKREHWNEWIDFFKRKAERYWAPRDVSQEGEQTPPKLAGEAPHSRPIPDPANALPVETAALVSSGNLDPDEVLVQKREVLAGEHSVAAEGVSMAVTN